MKTTKVEDLEQALQIVGNLKANYQILKRCWRIEQGIQTVGDIQAVVSQSMASQLGDIQDKLKLTTPQFAKALDLSNTAVYRWASGETFPRKSTLERLERLIIVELAAESTLELAKPRQLSDESGMASLFNQLNDRFRNGEVQKACLCIWLASIPRNPETFHHAISQNLEKLVENAGLTIFLMLSFHEPRSGAPPEDDDQLNYQLYCQQAYGRAWSSKKKIMDWTKSQSERVFLLGLRPHQKCPYIFPLPPIDLRLFYLQTYTAGLEEFECECEVFLWGHEKVTKIASRASREMEPYRSYFSDVVRPWYECIHNNEEGAIKDKINNKTASLWCVSTFGDASDSRS